MRKMVHRLLAWYRTHHRSYPWRRTTDPYRIWASEILLQQTRIAVVLGRYETLLKRFGSIQELAAAKDSDFLAVWSGLGYYRRAHNMLQCARTIVRDYGGQFPCDYRSLTQLPGIGRYTAGAIRNICFGQLTPAIDANIGRVIARLTDCRLPVASRNFQSQTETFFMEFGKDLPPGDYFQALMELGETVCLLQPNCRACPLRRVCISFRNGSVSRIPRSKPKRQLEDYHWYFLVLSKANAHYFTQNRRRPFLNDAWMFPDVLSRTELSPAELRRRFKEAWNIQVKQLYQQQTVRHAVTFRKVQAHVLLSTDYRIVTQTGRWINHRQLTDTHTSSITYKILEALA